MRRKESVFTTNQQLEKTFTKGLTSHDTVAICGLHPWKSTVDVWGEKLGMVAGINNLPNATSVSKELSNYIATLFTLKTGKRVRRCNAVLQHLHHSWMLTSIDRSVVGENSILECKIIDSSQAGSWRKELPLWVMLQMQHKMAVTGTSNCYIATLTRNTELIIHNLPRSEKIITALVSKGKEFWKLVQKKKLPVPNGTKATGLAIDRLFPVANEYEKIDIPEYARLLERYDELMLELKKMTKEIDTIKQTLKLQMGQASSAYIGNRRIDWRNATKKVLESNKLKQEMPNIYNKYLCNKTKRVFKIN